jgi:sugar transferase (PEP-CTERM system associated)
MRTFLRGRLGARTLTFIAFETCVILAAVVTVTHAWLGEEAPDTAGEWPKWLLIAAVTQFCLYYADMYDTRIIRDRRLLFVRAMYALGATSFIFSLLYSKPFFPDMFIDDGVFVITSLCLVTTILGWRIAFEWANRHVAPRERLLLVGTTKGAVDLAQELYDRSDLGAEIVGFIDPDPARLGAAVINPGVVGTIEDIPTLVRAMSVDRVVVSLADARGSLPMDKLLEMRLDGVTFDHMATVYEQYTGKIAVENLRPSWLIFSSGFRKGRLLLTSKRALDLVAAIIGVILALPLLILTALAVRLDSPGPILYRQQRVGQHGRLFNLFKFRSMRQDAEANTGAVWCAEGDTRITRVGRFIRRTRLDEIPQLWNVLRGDMSLVGPRPERPEFVGSLARDIPFYGQRHTVKPGLTGWAQVSYSYAGSVDGTMEKLQYDLFYIKNLSLPLDLFIMFCTAKIVLLGKGAR